jgi:hypothetical protein
MLDAERPLRFSLAHEWSHVERRDWAITVLTGVAEAVMFYQPLFWRLRRQLLLCQDYLADAHAAELAPSADEYAGFLVSLGRRRWAQAPVGALGIGSRKSRLFHRINMLIDRPLPLRHQCPPRWSFAAACGALALAVGLSCVSLQARANPETKPAPAKQDQPKSEGEKKEGPAPAPNATPLPDPITYTGKVTDKQTGAPIDGAVVIIHRSLSRARDPKTGRYQSLETTEHVTSAEGVYQFTVPPEQVAESSLYLEVDAKHPNYASKGRSGYAHSMTMPRSSFSPASR